MTGWDQLQYMLFNIELYLNMLPRIYILSVLGRWLFLSRILSSFT